MSNPSGYKEKQLEIREKTECEISALPSIFDEYVQHLWDGHKSDSTVYSYLTTLTACFRSMCQDQYLCDESFYENVLSSNIEQYFDEKNSLGTRTLQNQWSALNSFFGFLVEREYLSNNPMKKIPRPGGHNTTRELNYLTKDDVHRLLSTIGSDSSFLAQRDESIIKLAISTGLDISDLVNLNIDHIDLINGTMRVIDKKGERIISLGDPVLASLKNWIDFRNKYFEKSHTPALFISSFKRRLSTDAVGKMLHKYCEKAGVSQISFKDLKSSMVYLLAKENVSMEAIMDYLGVSDYLIVVQAYDAAMKEYGVNIYDAVSRLFDTPSSSMRSLDDDTLDKQVHTDCVKALSSEGVISSQNNAEGNISTPAIRNAVSQVGYRYGIPIEELDLSARTYNVLRRANIYTIDNLCDKTIGEICKIRSMDAQGIEEIQHRLYDFGLDFASSEVVLDNSGWPKEGDALPEVFIKFPFNFDFTASCLKRLRTGHANTALGYKWIYISDDKIFIHRGGQCCYQLRICPGKLSHTAVHYVYDDIDKYLDGYHTKPIESLQMILHKWTDNYYSTALRAVRSVAYGHAIADALGVPVEFSSRQKLKLNPVKDMMGYGTHHVPAGTWSDDTSMAIATLDSLASGVDYDDMMSKFCDWKTKAAYTATDEVFDMGISTNTAISHYQRGMIAPQCGCSGEHDNGNGSLMRIYPAVLYWHYTGKQKFAAEDFDEFIFDVSSLTHAHLRSKLSCGIYAQVLLELLESRTKASVRHGLHYAWDRYSQNPEYASELRHFARLFDESFSSLPEDEIKSSGYVVATLEAAIWCILNTDCYEECVLKAVNLGSDTDTVAAVAGALAGCLYGLEGIPSKWFEGLLRKDMIADICRRFTDGILENAHQKRLVDTHGHYVPGIDDGSATMEMSVAMIRKAYKQGVRDIICTSHSWGNYQQYMKRLAKLTERLATEKIPVRLYPGTEIACSERTMDVVVDQLESGYLHPLGKSNYILLEFDPDVKGIEILRCIKKVMELPQSGGREYRPIVAHVERYRCFQENPNGIKVLKAWGIPLQINAYSLVEEKKDATRELARKLLKAKLVTFVGSDAHRTTHRPPNVKSGIDYIYKNCDEDYADAVCYKNAERYLLGTD